MIILIPLGGTGDRFKKNGYTLPKALINVLGKPILYYLIDFIKNKQKNDLEYIYIPYNPEYDNYRIEDVLQNHYPTLKFKFLNLEKNTHGAAETINIALKKITCKDTPILCLDSDNFYSTDIIELWNYENKIITFDDFNDNPIYSYVKLNDNNTVIDIVEKEKISNFSCTGAYGFSSYKTLLEYTQKILDMEIKQKGEYYTSNVIKEMIKDGISFKTSNINISNWHCLGTPIQVQQFCNNYPKISCVDNTQSIKSMRICFDFDNTLVTFPKIKDDYTSVLPIQKNIDILKYLKSFGHTIIIYTARRMKTHNGNIGKVFCDIGKITFDTLERFNIPFDEIYFGKPYADVYIDDLALNCYDNIEKALGFYMNVAIPRDFNSISAKSIEIYVKKSEKGLDGEIFFYNNIPKQLKDIFPILLDYDEQNNKWYSVEKINGLTVSSLYLSELLTIDMLKHVMNSIQRIHNQEKKSEDYKHINMRGKIGNKLSIYGDAMYDWAKLYQSLIGYDKILQNKNISSNYQHSMTDAFENYFIELNPDMNLENMKLITKSLLFSLIPLHDNLKCADYLNLLKNI